MPKRVTHQRSISINGPLYERLRAKCRAERSQVAMVVDCAINQFLDKQEQSK